MASLLEIKPEEKQLELGGELGVGEQVVQGVEVPEEVGVKVALRQQLLAKDLGKSFFLTFTKFRLVLAGILKTCSRDYLQINFLKSCFSHNLT